MMGELISVIVPVYNDEKYVAQALDSIVNQTYRNLEILVIVDGSKDGSPAICDRYAVSDERVKVFHRENAGVSASRQLGIDNCHGTYFVTVDADDYVAVDYVEKLYAAIKKNDADVAVCGVSCFPDGSDRISAVFLPYCANEKLVLTKELLSTDFYKVSEDLILTDSWNKMHRTQFVAETKVRYALPKIFNGSDLQFEHRLAMHGPVYCVCRESLLFHRNRAGSMVTKKDKPLQEGFEIITESLIEECKQVGYPVKECVSGVYYGLIGLVVQDVFSRGGGLKERHARFQKLVAQNKSFLNRHQNDIERFKGFRTFKISRYPIPSFILGSALWLDAAVLIRKTISKLK